MDVLQENGPPRKERPRSNPLIITASLVANQHHDSTSEFAARHTPAGYSSPLRVVVAEHVVAPEPGRRWSTVIVFHSGCGRQHVHRVKDADQISSVVRRPPCRGPKYVVVLPAPSILPEPRVAGDLVVSA